MALVRKQREPMSRYDKSLWSEAARQAVRLESPNPGLPPLSRHLCLSCRFGDLSRSTMTLLFPQGNKQMTTALIRMDCLSFRVL